MRATRLLALMRLSRFVVTVAGHMVAVARALIAGSDSRW
jgi:hypothetical protein